MVIGVYSDTVSVNEALSKLAESGVEADSISVVVQEVRYIKDIEDHKDVDVAEDAAEGAAAGGVIGGLLGLLAGLTAVTIPGLGALLIGGPVSAALGLTGAAATTVSGAVTGVLAGGLVGALVSLGIPEEEALIYEQRVKQGDILLAVDTTDDESKATAMDIFNDTGAEEISWYELSD